MENEIDLREYITILLRYWKLIVGLTLVAVALAGIMSSLMPTYQATAIISSTSVAGVPTLALADAVLEKTIATLGQALPPTLATPSTLRGHLTTSQPSNTATVQLVVKDSDAVRAAAIANAWAESLVATISPSIETGPISLLQAGLDARISLLTDLSATQYALEWAIEDTTSLRARLARRSPSSPATTQDQLLLIALSSQTATVPNLPFQLQLTGLSETTVGDQITYLDDIAVSFEARRQILQQRAQLLKNDIRDMQEILNSAQTLSIGRAPTQIIVRATASDSSTPNLLQNVALAAAMGLMTGTFAAFGWEWWKKP